MRADAAGLLDDDADVLDDSAATHALLNAAAKAAVRVKERGELLLHSCVHPARANLQEHGRPRAHDPDDFDPQEQKHAAFIMDHGCDHLLAKG